MKRVWGIICGATMLVSSVAAAQEVAPPPPQAPGRVTFHLPETVTRPYDSTTSVESPQQAIHRKAALKGSQRRDRMATNMQFGYSPLRPPSSTVPWMGSPIAPPTLLHLYSFTPIPGVIYPLGYGGY